MLCNNANLEIKQLAFGSSVLPPFSYVCWLKFVSSGGKKDTDSDCFHFVAMWDFLGSVYSQSGKQ